MAKRCSGNGRRTAGQWPGTAHIAKGARPSRVEDRARPTPRAAPGKKRRRLRPVKQRRIRASPVIRSDAATAVSSSAKYPRRATRPGSFGTAPCEARSRPVRRPRNPQQIAALSASVSDPADPDALNGPDPDLAVPRRSHATDGEGMQDGPWIARHPHRFQAHRPLPTSIRESAAPTEIHILRICHDGKSSSPQRAAPQYPGGGVPIITMAYGTFSARSFVYPPLQLDPRHEIAKAVPAFLR